MHGPHYETSRWCAVVACSSSGVLVECERGIERSSSGGTQQQQRWSFVLFLACSGGGGGGGCCGGVVAAVVVFCVWWCCGKEVVVVSVQLPSWLISFSLCVTLCHALLSVVQCFHPLGREPGQVCSSRIRIRTGRQGPLSSLLLWRKSLRLAFIHSIPVA